MFSGALIGFHTLGQIGQRIGHFHIHEVIARP